MDASTTRLSSAARKAAANKNWALVGQYAMQIIELAPQDAEGEFLLGLVQKAARKTVVASDLFQRALAKNSERYDAAIELAGQYVLLNRYSDARSLLDQYCELSLNSLKYLDTAGEAYFQMNLYEQAWRLYEKASELQPEAEDIQVHLASCAVYLGKLGSAKSIYRKLLARHPRHQKIHYELAQIERVKNDRHIKQMLTVLDKSDEDPAANIFLYYAIGKEYEDLERWEAAFRYFKMGGDAVTSVANYDVVDDVALIDRIIEICDAKWLSDTGKEPATAKTPIFVVGLPRTGTTLTDRILSCHSQIQSAGESQLLQMVLRNGQRAGNAIGMSTRIIAAAAKRKAAEIATAFDAAIAHRLGPEEFYIEKLPENHLYLGFIAKAWPKARIVHLQRHPMDACFAMYKQSYFRFAYSFDNLARYYLAYDRLAKHWRESLGDRLIEVHYENLVLDHDGEIRRLMKRLNIEFEVACLKFDQNTSPVATASSVQVREKLHARSLGKWRKFERQLQPLRVLLEQGGIEINDS